MKKIVRWEAKRIDRQTTRYVLRTSPKGKGKEIGAYSSWNNALAHAAADPIIARIEDEAESLGYEIDREQSWGDFYSR